MSSQLGVALHLLDAEHLWRRHANITRLRHDVLLIGEPQPQYRVQS